MPGQAAACPAHPTSGLFPRWAFPPLGFSACGFGVIILGQGRRTRDMNAPRNTQYRHLDVQKIAGSLGADVRGVDLSQDVSDEVLAEIRAALLDNLVIAIRDQDITPAQQLAFARRWGEIHLHPFMEGMEGYPEILAIIKR